MKVAKEFLFTADFKCQQCGSIIGVTIYLAVVKSNGVEVKCRHCKTLYLVTEEGAYRADQVESDDVGDHTDQPDTPTVDSDRVSPSEQEGTKA